MNRIAPILLALGLACLFSQFGHESGTDPSQAGEIGTTTMAILATGFLAICVGGANLVRPRNS